MLDKAVTFLQKHLNNKLKGDAAQDKVVLAKIEKDFVQLTVDAITVILVNIEPDAISRSADLYRAPAPGGGSGWAPPELRLNLYILFASRFDAYESALANLSRVIRYFQENPVLTRENAPEIDPDLDKLIIELHDLPLAQQNDLWSILKIAHTPSVLYRVKMVIFHQTPAAKTPAVGELGQEVNAP